jgi:hypothetical protein
MPRAISSAAQTFQKELSQPGIVWQSDLSHRWKEIVQEYSCCHLTKESDSFGGDIRHR